MLKHAKKTLIAFGAIVLLGASAGAQAWDGYGEGYGPRHEFRRDWRALQHDRYQRDVYAERAHRAAYHGDYRAAHDYRRLAEQENRAAHHDHHRLHEDRYGRW